MTATLSSSDRSMTVSDLHKIFTNIERHATRIRVLQCGSQRTCNYFPTVLKAKSAFAGRELLELVVEGEERLQVIRMLLR